MARAPPAPADTPRTSTMASMVNLSAADGKAAARDVAAGMLASRPSGPPGRRIAAVEVARLAPEFREQLQQQLETLRRQARPGEDLLVQFPGGRRRQIAAGGRDLDQGCPAVAGVWYSFDQLGRF